MARIIFLHGASSSGKSTLATAIRKGSPHPWLHFSIDHLRDSGAWQPYDYPDWPTSRPAFFDGFHRAAAGFANAGNGLILEHILDTAGWHQQLQQLLKGNQLLFIAVHTPPAELCIREQRRGDRPQGSAARDAARIHDGLHYDLELDGTRPPENNAAKVLRLMNGPMGTSKFFLPRD